MLWLIAFLTLVFIAGIVFVFLLAAYVKQAKSIQGRSSERNEYEGKKVVFAFDSKDDCNADGVRGHLEVVGNSDYKQSFYVKYVKRIFDVVLSFFALLLFSPVLLAIIIAIEIDDPGFPIFLQKRIGQNKKYFYLYKFRSMKVSTPHDVPTHMLENPNQYITRVGKFCRAHSLDELPQILNIFLGNMSVVGPRPGLWNQDLLTAERDKYGANDVKPGLTGLAQISGRDTLSIEEKARLDGEYAKNIGFLLDLKCLIKSIHVFGSDKTVLEGGTGNPERANRKAIK